MKSYSNKISIEWITDHYLLNVDDVIYVIPDRSNKSCPSIMEIDDLDISNDVGKLLKLKSKLNNYTTIDERQIRRKRIIIDIINELLRRDG